MKRLFPKIMSAIIVLIAINDANAQGCVAIRSGCGADVGGGALLSKGSWLTATNFRYFHSYKHFRGKHEEVERVENGTEVINDSFFLDLLISYGLTDRVALNFTLPFVYHGRSSMYEHGGNPPDGLGDRHKTFSRGLADIKFSASYWLLDPAKHASSNFSLGLGIKLPSGNYKAKDTFYNPEREVHVDQSIQPGDGGFGITFESQGYHALSDRFILSENVYYLVNPREKYNIDGFRGPNEYSVPDQYAARLGVLYMTSLHGLNLYAGGRVEGIPSSDLIGGDEGFRRPGYILSIEPGLSYSLGNTAFNFTVPIAVERNRTKNFSDKQNGRHGDAAFADYLINFGFSYRFGGGSGARIPAIQSPINLN